MTRAGDYGHRVTFQVLVAGSQDSQGGRAATPATVIAGLPCAVESLSASADAVAGDQLTTVSRWRLRIRRREDIRPGQLAIVTFRESGSSITTRVESVGYSDDGLESRVVVSAVQA